MRPDAAHQFSKPVRWTVALLFGLCFAVAYWSSLSALHTRWTIPPNGHYSHGYLLVLITLWLLYESKRKFASIQTSAQPWPLPILLVASLFWMVAGLIQVQLVQLLVLPVLILAWIASVFGWSAARTLLVPLGIVYFALPMWDGLVGPLRELTVFVSSAILQLFDISAYIEGTHIHIAAGSFFVADGCSGLSYLLTSLLLSTIYGFLYVADLRNRLLLVLYGIALGLITNWIRVVGLIIIGHFTEMRSSLIEDHGTYGWIIYAVMLVPFLGIARRLEGTQTHTSDELGAVSAVQTSARNGVAISVAGLLFLLAGPGLLWSIPTNQALKSASFDFPAVPGWQMIDPTTRQSTWTPSHFSGEDHEFRASYVPQDGRSQFASENQNESVAVPVDVFVLVYAEQSQGKELVNDTNVIALEQDLLSTNKLDLQQSEADFRFEVVLSRVAGGRYPVLVLSWYSVGGRPTPNSLTAKLLQIPAFFSSQTDARLNALAVDCQDDQCVGATERLTALAAALAPTLNSGTVSYDE